ncbi:hypothetical protein L484_012883 [Morus notabilis]|uniref:Uncharacterized protein n=1 Tax=Morus notabilis TaxID=981085 RepID=W9RFN0_9ROSA|nr:hypothetical protein L484_012883 [Morus notabilis]
MDIDRDVHGCPCSFHIHICGNEILALVGYGCYENSNTTIEEALRDVNRVKFMADYLDDLLRAARYDTKL